MALLLAAGAGLSGCPSDCEVACGKLEFCTLLPNINRGDCIDRCEEASAEAARVCADCLEQSGCGTIAGAGCAKGCDPILPHVDP